jgi:hypothetical protein
MTEYSWANGMTAPRASSTEGNFQTAAIETNSLIGGSNMVILKNSEKISGLLGLRFKMKEFRGLLMEGNSVRNEGHTD